MWFFIYIVYNYIYIIECVWYYVVVCVCLYLYGWEINIIYVKLYIISKYKFINFKLIRLFY